MKITGLLVLLLISFNFSFSQNSKSLKELTRTEKEMKSFAIEILAGIHPADRIKADSIFTRQFVQALKTPYSFNYPFDSLETISRLYAPDSSFRIFTWQLVVDENSIRQHGAIQVGTKDGSLKLFPLIDKSDLTEKIQDTITNHLGWIGAVYYKIVQTERRGKPVYTLLGYDENNMRSNKKYIEVLEFVDGQPKFGGYYFNAPDNTLKPRPVARYVMEYKKHAGPRLTFDKELDMIIMEHLISESNEPLKKWTLIGDGDYEGFKWIDGKWNYISKVFNEVTPEGQPPVPQQILDDAGNIDESKVPGFEDQQEPTKKPRKKN